MLIRHKLLTGHSFAPDCTRIYCKYFYFYNCWINWVKWLNESTLGKNYKINVFREKMHTGKATINLENSVILWKLSWIKIIFFERKVCSYKMIIFVSTRRWSSLGHRLKNCPCDWGSETANFQAASYCPPYTPFGSLCHKDATSVVSPLEREY